MRRLIVVAIGLVVVGLVVTETAMQPSAEERVVLGSIYGATAALTVLMFVVGRRMRYGSLQLAVQVASIGVGVVTGVTVLLAAQTMFLSDHDRNLVLLALALGTALGVSLAVAIGSSIGSDLDRLGDTARKIASGDLSARTGVDRRDELGMAATAVDEMADRLEAAEEERRIFLASVGHDLRSPLASMKASIEALEDGLASDPQQYLRGIANDTEHLARLVDDLFLLSKLEAGRLELAPEPIDLIELADGAVEAAAAFASRLGVSIRTTADRSTEVDADGLAISRVVRNLIDNAVRFSPEGGIVTVDIATDADSAVLRVIDEGPGFDPSVRETAFDRFVTADPSRAGGAGLGLAIAKGIVSAHGGGIAIEDGPGGRVAVTLPRTASVRARS
jgi:two-component system sensor histidine kinase BaeS